MTGRAFLDSNVIVYLYDVRTPAKHLAAGRLMHRLVDEQVLPMVSTQVLQEAYSVLTRKLGMEPAAVLDSLQRMEGASFRVEGINAPLIWRAAARSIEDKLSIWDALIVESALAAQCSVLYSEDLQHGRTFGNVTVRNPFG
jgi:predicted nucleic acid-binding protein